MKIPKVIRNLIVGITVTSMLPLNALSVSATGVTMDEVGNESETETETETETGADDGGSAFTPDYSGNKGKIQTFIRMSAGKNTTGSDDTGTLTTSDIRFLGVYLSNFYIPFKTELGNTSSEISQNNIESMRKALQTNLSFSDDMADTLTKGIMNMSKTNNKELKLYVSKAYQKDLVEFSDVNLSYYVAMSIMSGRLKDTVSYHYNFEADSTKRKLAEKKEKEGKITQEDIEKLSFKTGDTLSGISTACDIYNGKYKYAYFGYEDNGVVHPVLDACIDGKTQSSTASMLAFEECLSNSSLKRGYGLNYLDFTKDEKENETGGYKTVSKNVDEDEDLYKMSIYGNSLVVDSFGNIILKGANHQLVMMPACMNPYVWIPVDSEGKDIEDKGAGTGFNMINMISMSLQDNGVFAKSEGTSSINDNVKSIVPDTDSLVKTISDNDMKTDLDVRDGGGWLYKDLYRLRISIDDTETDFGVPWLWFDGEGTGKLRKRINAAMNDLPLSSLNYPLSFFTDSNSSNELICSFSIGDSGLSAFNNSIDVYDKMVFIDNFGTFNYNSGTDDIDWSAINFDHYLGNTSDIVGTWKDVGNDFSNLYENLKDGSMSVPDLTNTEAVVAIFSTYVYAGLSDDDSKKADTIGLMGYRMCFDSLPDIIDKDLTSIDSDTAKDQMASDVLNYLYYMLNPGKTDYFRVWLTNKVNAFLVGWHEDMTGTKGVGALTGTTKYKNNISYVTMPDLSEIEWTNNLMALFESAIPYIAIIMLVVFVIIFISGALSLQRCIIGFFAFMIALLIPIPIINGVVGSSNDAISGMYSSKFMYWAMIEHQAYSTAIDEAAEGDSYSNYLKTLYSENQKINANQGSENIILKWQAPKKMSSLMLTKRDNNALTALQDSLLTKNLKNAYSGESYTDDSSDVYLYRSYIDISNFSRYIYRGIADGIRKVNPGIKATNVKSSLKEAFKNKSTMDSSFRDYGYSTDNLGRNFHSKVFATSRIVDDAYKDRNMSGFGLTDYAGINQDFFNFSIPMFTQSRKGFVQDSLISSAKSSGFKKLLAPYTSVESTGDGDDDEGGSTRTIEVDTGGSSETGYTEADLTGLAAYGLYSESVFYYYSWLLYDYKDMTTATANSNYKDLLLKNGEDFFYNMKGNGELKDFMDMRSLFTYVIPYLKRGNDIVDKFDDIYGLTYYPGVSSEEGKMKNYTGNDAKMQKYWSNLNTARLYNIYTPWVGLMYDCSYSDPVTIRYMGKSYTISDPIDPACYPADRPMIFSRSEMEDFGLTVSDLTEIEKKIIDCNDEMARELFDLLNYYTFNDVVMNTAAAMKCTFIFNKVFSESGLFSNNIEIYPQSFEVSGFSYDAFLRFVLSSSTGTSMTENKDFYATVVGNSSMTTAILMIVLDIISIYVLPILKVLVLILIFVSGILLILEGAFMIRKGRGILGAMCRILVAPMVLYFIITVGMAYAISCLMGSGNSAITGTGDAKVILGDPATACIALLIVDVVCVVAYFRIVRGAWRSTKTLFKSVGEFAVGVASGVVTTNVVARAIKKISSVSEEKSGRRKEFGAEPDKENDRATRRGSRKRRSDEEDKGEYKESGKTKEKERAIRYKTVEKSGKEFEAKKSKINEKTKSGLKGLSSEGSEDK